MNIEKPIVVRMNHWLTLTLLMVVTGTLFSACDEPATELEDLIAFVNVHVIPMDEERILENQTVIIHDGRIADIRPSNEIELPGHAVQIDGGGKYLIPGLAEMHGHIPGANDRQYLEDILFLYISNGVTFVRNMAGNPYHVELRDRIANGEVSGPSIAIASPWLGGNNIPSADEAPRVVAEYQEAGFDLMKMGGISLEAYERVAETAQELGMPFGGHIPGQVGLVRALEAGQKSIDHLDRYVEFLVPEDADTEGRSAGFFGSGLVDLADTDRIPLAVELTLEAGTWNVPTLSLVEHLASPEPPEEMIQWPEMRYMPRNVLDGWVESKHNYQARDDFQPEATDRLVEIRQLLTKALHDAGAPIALGSDAPQFFNVPGFSIHHEMQMMVEAGLTPYEVLVTGTRNPALYLGTPDEFGTVEQGMRADLILLDANPLEDIANVQQRSGVMVRGEWMPESEIQERLQQIAERER